MAATTCGGQREVPAGLTGSTPVTGRSFRRSLLAVTGGLLVAGFLLAGRLPVHATGAGIAAAGVASAAWDVHGAAVDGQEGSADDSSPAPAASAATLEEIARKQWEELDSGGFLRALERVRQEVGDTLPGLDWESTLQALRQGSLPWNATDVLAALLRALAEEVVTGGGLLLRLLVLAVLLAVLQSIEHAFGNEAVARAAHAVVFLVLVALALVSFRDALALARGTIESLVNFLMASLPVLLPLLAASGAVATAGLFHPLVVAVAQTVSVLVSQWVLPLIFLAAVIELVGHFPLATSLSGLARLLRQAAIVLLGLAMTVFLAVVAIQGAAGTVADGIALRTAKYLVGAFVPVVGGMLADSVELVVTSSLLLRNAANLLGLVAVFALVALPLVKLAVLVFIYRLVAAAIQPVGPGPVTASLQAMGDHIVLVAVATAVVGLMFFIVLSVMLAAGNAAVMMR